MTEGNRPKESDEEMPVSNFSRSLASFVVALLPFAVAISAAESIGLTPFDFSGTLVAFFCVSSLFGFIGHILILHMNRSSLELMSSPAAILIGGTASLFSHLGVVICCFGAGIISATVTYLGILLVGMNSRAKRNGIQRLDIGAGGK